MDMDESQRERVLTDIVQHAGDFSVFNGSLTLGGFGCRWKGGKDRLFGWGSAAQVDPGGGGAQGHQCTCRLQLISPSTSLPPSLSPPNCFGMHPPHTYTNRAKQVEPTMSDGKVVGRECFDCW